MCCYVDGVKKSRRVKNPGPLQKDGWDLCIGNSVPDFGGELLSFDGMIDEVRIYNRALSSEEIKALTTGTRAGADVLPTPETTATQADPAARLKELQSLYEQGLITRNEFEKKKTEILNSL